MKPLVRKIIESGLVSQHVTLLMEKWGTLDHGATSLVGSNAARKASEETLIKFAEELEGLLDQNRDEIRETRLSMNLTNPRIVKWGYGGNLQAIVFDDEMRNLVFPPTWKTRLHPGKKFQLLDDDMFRWYEITDVVPLYENDEICAYQVSYGERTGAS